MSKDKGKRYTDSEKKELLELFEVSAPAVASSGGLRVWLPNGVQCEIPQGFGRCEAAAFVRELAAC